MICEHRFEDEDPHHKGYSMLEWDLYADLNLTIRKNLKDNKYELVRISDNPMRRQKKGEVVYSLPTLKAAVDRANALEAELTPEYKENTKICCGYHCPAAKTRSI
jgi:hypothetical protein